MLVLLGSVTACGSGGSPSSATGATERFLARYVTTDGRVIRHGQGGDIVSEGQAYAMLLAETAGRPALVRTIWSWTRMHLGRPDGLFAWHATAEGQIEDPQSATDADILIAYALLRYVGPDEAALHGAGRRVATAVLANESVRLADGAPLVVAGPWATSTAPPTVNPSYLMPGVFEALARFTGDGRWTRAASSAVVAIRQLTANGRRLPPDWAVLAGGRLLATPGPRQGPGVQYGLDAARLPLWFATACDPGARRLAAGWWRNVLHHVDGSGAVALTPTGAVVAPGSSPLIVLANAAAAAAAGDAHAAQRLRAHAAALAERAPSYYGDAWAALGPALLDRSIDPCTEPDGG